MTDINEATRNYETNLNFYLNKEIEMKDKINNNTRLGNNFKSKFLEKINTRINNVKEKLLNEYNNLIDKINENSSNEDTTADEDTTPVEDNTPVYIPKKYACLVGVNYENTSSELNGCVNDVNNFKNVLTSKFNYTNDNITLLLNENATKTNILSNFRTLMENANAGDNLCFSFSGHGYYRYDVEREEKDSKDELIVSNDMQSVTDDEFRELIDTYLKDGVNLFCLFDNCHSGTILDLKYNFNDSNELIVNNSNYNDTKGNVILLSGCKDAQVSIETQINGRSYGIMTYVLTYLLTNRDNDYTWNTLYNEIKEILNYYKFNQIPQLSSGKDYDFNASKFNI